MRRPTHPDIAAGLDTAGPADRPSGAESRVTSDGPSYVQSVLFARRPTRAGVPGQVAGTRATTGESLVSRTSKKGTEPCAS
jgi:hypothetical protein